MQGILPRRLITPSSISLRSLYSLRSIQKSPRVNPFTTTALRMSEPQPHPQAATIYLPRGFDDQDDATRPAPLETQLAPIPRDTNTLIIKNETPSDDQWRLLSTHFTSIKDLTLSSGFNEMLNDNVPLHWPLERLVLDSPCGELVKTPWVREGLVKHLQLVFSMGLRFEGPSNDELIKMQKERIARGEEEEIKTESGIKITYLPELVQRWLAEKYAISPGEEKKAQEKDSEQEQDGKEVVPNLETLEILENDVHDVLLRMALSIPGILANLKTLRLRATNACDFHYSEDILHQMLPQLGGLKTLDLTLGSEYSNSKYLTELYRHLPPNIETLRFRSVAQLAKSENWSEWASAFQNPEYLPQLRRLTFLLDLSLTEGHALALQRKKQSQEKSEGKSSEGETADQARESTETRYKVQTEDLRLAKRACEQIWKAAEDRGILGEPFSEDFPESFPDQKPLDERWEGL